MNVSVTLVTRQQDGDDVQETHIDSTGVLEQRNDTWLLNYTEPKTEESGETAVKVRVYVDGLMMWRKGDINAVMPLQVGKQYNWKYETPYGLMEFPVKCERFNSKMTATGGRFFAAYTVKTAGDTADGMQCTMEISVKEVAQ